MQESKSPSVARRGAIYICLTSKNERDPLLSMIVRMSVRMSRSPEALHGLCILDAFHPHAKEKVQNLLDLAMKNSLSGLRLVWTCGFWFKKDEGGIEDLGTDLVLVQGMLAKLRNAATNFSPANWKIKSIVLMDISTLMLRTMILEDEKCGI